MVWAYSRAVAIVLTIGALCATTAGIARAGQSAGAGSSAASLDGKDTFQEYCGPCHGARGKGDGPAASALRERPSNLTTIAKRKGGFRAAEVEAIIKGSDAGIVAHGTLDMPVWGRYFSAIDRNDAEAQLRITNLVKYLETIQVK